ncbi:hypothetical protein OZN62_07905 [Aurantiacibacter sp. MUD11]|uniref:hypothetical protein n=1 Tax=Aurantiacibacter sp. MUD11 TaxID=3003265 RepID=UPI0022AB4301|nr:hypothetical protein [Aurantiacibacter sp. MUD11]WAT16869.1 hypothetical protein OZN62_07905 [Aurantiacibacter sp. MUD11]
MASAFDDRRDIPAIAGACECEGARHAVAITRLTADGCMLEANDDWPGASDFVHLSIDGSIEMNGKLAWAQGRRAQLRFFGQVHPAAIAKLLEAATP